ncbi:MAG: geranylgeranyl reductase family protein [Rhizobiales bacterium]|nr:geranylgeranyl reductase family protein [Hyphomicrobiales bacterium]
MSEAVWHTDVLIAGLGPAGACAAAETARAGWSVIAVDRKTEAGVPVQCAELVPGPIGMEVADVSVAQEQLITSMVTFVEDAEPDVVENFPGHMINRQAFDRHLCVLAEDDGARCVFGAAIKTVMPDGIVVLSDGTRIVPRVIIGADGPKSVVGAAIGQANAGLVETRQITVALNEPHFSTDIFLSADIPGGYGWLFPKGAAANIGVGVRPEDKSRLKELLMQLHGSMIVSGRVGGEVQGYTGGPIPVGGMVDPFGMLGKTLVLLAGDAAGLTNPVTGAGINSAVLSGRRAGQYAGEFLAGNEDAASDYLEELEDLFKPALDRALKRRGEVLAAYEQGEPTPQDLKRGWIAYSDYWAA